MMSVDKVIFRTDGSPRLGYGHLMRCRALAHALKDQGACCIMVGPKRNDRTESDAELFVHWIEYESSSGADDANILVELARQYGCGVAVLDDYHIDVTYQKIMLESGVKWLQFDALANRPLWAEWVLNASPAATPEKYHNLLKRRKQKVLAGPRYAILRPEFSNPYKQLRRSKGGLRILVTFGGGDDRGAILFVLRTLYESLPDATFTVVSGMNNPRNSAIQDWVSQRDKERVILHINPQEIQRIFSSCDLAVMSGGTTTFEVATCGVPMVLLTIADNQVRQARGWAEHRAAIYLGAYGGVLPKQLWEATCSLRADMARMKKMSESCTQAVDGFGANRVAAELIKGG